MRQSSARSGLPVGNPRCRRPEPPARGLSVVHVVHSGAAKPSRHRTIRLEPLPHDLQPELVESAERRQVGAGELGNRGSVSHVEVFRMGGVGTSIFGRPRRLSDDRRAPCPHTLIWEEPVNGRRSADDRRGPATTSPEGGRSPQQGRASARRSKAPSSGALVKDDHGPSAAPPVRRLTPKRDAGGPLPSKPPSTIEPERFQL